jgi:hypothetical protein
MPDLSNLTDEQLLKLHAEASQPKPEGSFDLSNLSDDELMALHAKAKAPNPKLEKTDVGGMADAGMRGFVKGGLAGFGDEMYGLVGAAVNPQNSDKDFWHRYHESRDYARRRDAKAEEDHPNISAGTQMAGSVASAFAPGMSALNAGKGAGLIEIAGKGALQGGLVGAGEAKEFTDIPGDAARGAMGGAAIAGTMGVAGKVLGAAKDALKPSKVASVLLNVPEEAVERYIANPSAVQGARPRAEVVQDFLERAEALKQEVIGGSQAARETLRNEGQKISGSQIADIFDAHADEIVQRSEGVMDDPQLVAAYKWLKGMSQKYRPHIPEELTDDLANVLEAESSHGFPEAASFYQRADVPAGMTAREALEAEAERQLSTNRVKDLVQSMQKRTQYETGPGQFHDVDNLVRQRVGGDVNKLLKDTSPEYAKQMIGVANDSRLLNEVGELAKTPQGFDSFLKRTQRGNTPHATQSLKEFDTRTGGGLMDELQNSAVKDALDKGYMNGSRAVNMHGNVAETIGEAIGGTPGKWAGKVVGFLGGASVDKYGGPIARGAVDASAKLQSMLSSSEGIQTLGKYAGPLLDAAKRGNQSLAVTHYMLSQQDPEYSQKFQGKKP